MKKLILTTAVVCLASSAFAHDYPGADCVAPIRPANDQNDRLWQAFLNEIDAFRDCTQNKMEWHQSAVVAHQQDAKLAVEQWNEFVRTKLNAPEDFPWPPPEESPKQ